MSYIWETNLSLGMVLVFRHLFYRNYVGLSFWPFIILRSPALRHDAVLLNHERIHLRQQAELLLVFFYLWYFLEWVLKSFYYFDFHKGYFNISFEREAYHQQENFAYLPTRAPFSFLKFLINTPDGP